MVANTAEMYVRLFCNMGTNGGIWAFVSAAESCASWDQMLCSGLGQVLRGAGGCFLLWVGSLGVGEGEQTGLEVE